MNFRGVATPLSETGASATAHSFGVGLAEVWTLLHIAGRSCGYLASRRPEVVFCRRTFRCETAGVYDTQHPELSHPDDGDDDTPSESQYQRLERAVLLDRVAALRSGAWGIGQVLGLHAESLGYADVEDMVGKMLESEEEQLRCILTFAAVNGLLEPLKNHDWARLAERFVEPSRRPEHRDETLRAGFALLVAQGLPDFSVRVAQVRLMFLGFGPGPIDGVLGEDTTYAIGRFQVSVALPVTGRLDPETVARLASEVESLPA